MRSQIRYVLFALIALPAAACGGDRDVPAPSVSGDLIAPPSRPTADVGITPEVVSPKLDEAVRTAGGSVSVPTTYVETLELGKALAAKRDSSRARELLEAAAKLDKKQPEPHIELARLFITLDEKRLAIKSANKAVKLAPDSSLAWNTLGRAELTRFNYDGAIVAFGKSAELNPENAWAWNNLGFTHLQLKHYQDAVDALVKATSKNGATGYMFNNLGTAYEHLDQLDDARVAFERGGALGSTEASSSRKRLEGVDTIVVMKAAKTDRKVENTYDNAEPMPSPEDADAVPKLDITIDEVQVDEPEPKAPEPKADVDEPEVKAPEPEVVEEPAGSSAVPKSEQIKDTSPI